MRLAVSLIALVLLGSSSTFVWAATQAPKSAAPQAATEGCAPDTPAAIKEISGQMASIWCEKLAQCSPNSGMSAKECHKVLKKSFQDGFKNIPSGQKVEVDEAGLCQCVQSIRQDSCEALRHAQMLPGCGFIRLLNRS